MYYGGMTTESTHWGVMALAGAGAYLLGAVPFGLLAGRLRGVDIRRVGSGNIGATNVFRTLGPAWGIGVFVLDALKGFIPVAVLPWLLQTAEGRASSGGAVSLAFLAIAGHNWPVFLRFKGGKGVATTAGVLLALAPWSLGIGFGVWLVVFLVGRYVSLASIAAAAAIPAAAWSLRGEEDGKLLPWVLTVLGALAIWRHRSNVRRLLHGTEHRFSRSAAAAPVTQEPQSGAAS